MLSGSDCCVSCDRDSVTAQGIHSIGAVSCTSSPRVRQCHTAGDARAHCDTVCCTSSASATCTGAHVCECAVLHGLCSRHLFSLMTAAVCVAYGQAGDGLERVPYSELAFPSGEAPLGHGAFGIVSVATLRGEWRWCVTLARYTPVDTIALALHGCFVGMDTQA